LGIVRRKGCLWISFGALWITLTHSTARRLSLQAFVQLFTDKMQHFRPKYSRQNAKIIPKISGTFKPKAAALLPKEDAKSSIV